MAATPVDQSFSLVQSFQNRARQIENIVIGLGFARSYARMSHSTACVGSGLQRPGTGIARVDRLSLQHKIRTGLSSTCAGNRLLEGLANLEPWLELKPRGTTANRTGAVKGGPRQPATHCVRINRVLENGAPGKDDSSLQFSQWALGNNPPKKNPRQFDFAVQWLQAVSSFMAAADSSLRRVGIGGQQLVLSRECPHSCVSRGSATCSCPRLLLLYEGFRAGAA